MSDERRWEQLDQVAALFHSAVQQATLLQNAAQRSNEQSARAANKLQVLSEQLPSELAAAVAQQLESAARSAADRMAESWSEANAAAARAASVYAKAEAKLTWKLMAYICTGLVAAALLIVGVLLYLKPTEAELQALREERRMLTADIERLRRMGAGLEVTYCKLNGQLKPCVQVDPNSPDFKGGYRLLPSR